MGEAADDIINGDCCAGCGEWFLDDESPGHPRYCSACEPQERKPRSEGKRRRAKLRRQRENKRRRDALASADKTGWTELAPFHFRRMVDGKPLDWWPSTGKWLYEGVITKGGVDQFIAKKEASDAQVRP